MFWIVVPGSEDLMRIRRFNCGVAENGAASTPWIWKLSSGMRRSLAHCAIPDRREKAGDRFPHVLAPRKSPPLRANQPNQPVAFVDGHDEIFVWTTQPIHQQSLDIARHLLERRILLHNLPPRIRVHMRLRRASRAGIKRRWLGRIPAAAEERHVDGNRELLPLRVVHREIAQRSNVCGNAPIAPSRLAAEENGAGLAAANNPAPL